MQVEVRNDSVFITGYVNSVERLSKPIRETLHGKVRTFLERIRAGVFRDALKRNEDVLVLLNHDYNRVLASTKDSTAVLEEDNIGLRAEITITDPEVVQKAREGKLTGWSFGFIANDDELSSEGKDEIRTVTNMELREVSILDDTKAPAYYGTLIETREGGAEVMHIRVEAINEPEAQEESQSVSLDELAALVAAKVIEALKAEEKAETEETEEDTEEVTEEQTEETTEEETVETAEEETEETEQDTEEENRAVSDFEARLAKLKGA